VRDPVCWSARGVRLIPAPIIPSRQHNAKSVQQQYCQQRACVADLKSSKPVSRRRTSTKLGYILVPHMCTAQWVATYTHGHPDHSAALKKHAVSDFSDSKSKHHDPAHVAAFALDPTNLMVEEGK